MAEAIWSRIQSDLRRIYLTAPGLPSAVKWEGKGFAPTPGVAFVKERVEPGSSVTSTLGSAGRIMESGIYLLDLHWPGASMGGSVFDAKDMADRIRLTFWHGREVASSGVDPISGTVLSSEVRRPYEADGWFVVPIRVSFYIRRPTLQRAV